jgi:hypothetical protein
MGEFFGLRIRATEAPILRIQGFQIAWNDGHDVRGAISVTEFQEGFICSNPIP